MQQTALVDDFFPLFLSLFPFFLNRGAGRVECVPGGSGTCCLIAEVSALSHFWPAKNEITKEKKKHDIVKLEVAIYFTGLPESDTTPSLPVTGTPSSL